MDAQASSPMFFFFSLSPPNVFRFGPDVFRFGNGSAPYINRMSMDETKRRGNGNLDNEDDVVMRNDSTPRETAWKAQTQAERGILPILKRIRAVFDKVGIKEEESVVVRITGCPNGCARPYMAEVGFVYDGPNSYQIWLGGTPNQTTLAEMFMNKVKLQDIEKLSALCGLIFYAVVFWGKRVWSFSIHGGKPAVYQEDLEGSGKQALTLKHTSPSLGLLTS
ncbi:hypothetical protein ZWY2020_037476 [Hordeum vulgare]|nr:hypothetical protein ZWY2020_037476 [Hordeum vulgare]